MLVQIYRHIKIDYKLRYEIIIYSKGIVFIMSKGTRYDVEFKQMIVNLYNSGKSITELMSEYDVAKATLYKWVNLYSQIEIANGDVTTNAEIIKLRNQQLL